MSTRWLCAALMVTSCSLAAIGCASSQPPGRCVGASCPCQDCTKDLAPGTGGGGEVDDLGVPDLAATGTSPDMTPTKSFGEACSDNQECVSNICVFTGAGGTCTQVCPAIGCPAGYGCYNVVGVIDPGQVASVCVPENNLLCTPCAKASDCGAMNGADHCLPYPTGSFCGRDCSNISCPPTFTCKDIPGGDAGVLKQCVPSNGACDCTPQSTGRSIACTITTPLNTSCPGTSICNGAAGWGACTPPSTSDTPDDGFVDSNCDGIDGDVNHAIFVDVVSGNDGNLGTMKAPVKTISWGQTLASHQGKDVYVSKGTYLPVTLVAGVNLYGGYDAASNWQRASGNVTTITGGSPAIDASGITSATTVALFTVVGSNAPSGTPGASSYGVRVVSSTGLVTLHQLTITAGNGSDGANASIANGTRGHGSDYNPEGLHYDGYGGATSDNGGAGGGGGQSA
jgi:hypothetical protein